MQPQTNTANTSRCSPFQPAASNAGDAGTFTDPLLHASNHRQHNGRNRMLLSSQGSSSRAYHVLPDADVPGSLSRSSPLALPPLWRMWHLLPLRD
ncbi:uncharacterized protein PADG_03080 [Paracoccidioides brasiliensis Pb18]|uniref:Uncharacterized protein n=1 Tax=Paracoccidioides brasiliensis (strain Pb18) TaxID=502780 RepID=C1G7C5_PARBD|nr:uncharacterized protein PADG_03080 [Paracoccidioides brasiliensis Pb18]EEH46982.2 hypothetical protein PADG_03080 [Paracoccidioides brasiliensis Pb18]